MAKNGYSTAIASGNGAVRIYDLRNMKQALNKIDLRKEQVLSLQISTFNQDIVLGYEDRIEIVPSQMRDGRSVFDKNIKQINRASCRSFLEGEHGPLSYFQLFHTHLGEEGYLAL